MLAELVGGISLMGALLLPVAGDCLLDRIRLRQEEKENRVAERRRQREHERYVSDFFRQIADC